MDSNRIKLAHPIISPYLSKPMIRFAIKHIHILIYAGFWLSMINYGLLAPPERLSLLESNIISKGWHLSLLGVFFGLPVIILYSFRFRKRDTAIQKI